MLVWREVERQFLHNCDDTVNLSELTVGEIVTTSIQSSKFSLKLTQTQVKPADCESEKQSGMQVLLSLYSLVCLKVYPLLFHRVYIYIYIWNFNGSGSSVGIATELRAGRSRIESRWGRVFPPVQTGPGAHPASCIMGTGSFPGVKCGRGVLLTTHPLLVLRSWKSRAISLPTLWATPGL